MVQIEPSAQVASNTVHRGFVVRDAGAMPWRDDKLMQPEFLEVRYTDNHNGEGWRWTAELRGRRVNAGGKLGAADASLWFGDHGRIGTPPTWVTETVLEHMPAEVDGSIAAWSDSRVPLEPWDGSKGTPGVWRGRHRVVLQNLRPGPDEVAMTSEDPQVERLLKSRYYPVVEFVPNEAADRG